MLDVTQVDFRTPVGEPALVAPESVSWRVFKNPVALYIGGISAVLLELALPQVRCGVWNHSTFRSDPMGRLRRTGLAALVTVYGPRSTAERMIRDVTRLHEAVRGETPDGVAYHALDPELLGWVHSTACFGFLQAYHRFVRPLTQETRDDFYAEATPSARLYGAPDSPGCEAELEARFEAVLPRLEASPVVFEFLEIMRSTPRLPPGLGALREALIRAAVDRVPAPVRERLGLGAQLGLSGWQCRAVRLAARGADRLPLPSAPPAQACQRLGLPASHLYRGT